MLTCVSALALTSCKKEGCTDAKASNYSSEAKKDDGSCTYKVTPPAPIVITTPFTAKVDGVKFIETSLTGVYGSMFNTITIQATKDDKYIRIKVPGNITPGTYTFGDPTVGSQGGYYHDGSNTYAAETGTGSLVIVSRTSPSIGVPGKISGTFSFNAKPYSLGGGSAGVSYSISSGQFKLDYQ